ENLAAELTSAVYPLALRSGLKDSWLKVELALWRAMVETVEKWARRRPPVLSPEEAEAWQAGFLGGATENAFYHALRNGVRGSLLELELCLYRAFRRVVWRRCRFPKAG